MWTVLKYWRATWTSWSSSSRRSKKVPVVPNSSERISWLIASTTVMKGSIPPISAPASSVTSPASEGVMNPLWMSTDEATNTQTSNLPESSPLWPSRYTIGQRL